jgi:predicted nucleotide-binding protein
MDTIEELKSLAAALTEAGRVGDKPEIKQPLDTLVDAAKAVGRSFSGSWLGHHARVYYEGLQPPPPGARWSAEWGFEGEAFLGLGSRGEWREYDGDAVKAAIRQRAGDPDLATARDAANAAGEVFKRSKAEIISILSQCLSDRDDSYLSGLKAKVEELDPVSPAQLIRNVYMPRGELMSRDMAAITAGKHTPPHIAIIADVQSLQHSFGICKSVASMCAEAASHLTRKARGSRPGREARQDGNIFLGHGRSPLWRELKDFLQDRLHLRWDEFNREPTAGIATTARLLSMLDNAAFAFLILTAEDETKEGAMQARMNVVHEVGLFQGRLGFERAIVLLEEGCAEFSNIHGLGQIRFPKGNISAAFEEIRRTLEREGLLEHEG